MKIYVLPISGGGFISQIALLAELYDATYDDSYDYHRAIRQGSTAAIPGTPDLVLSSSGGNVAAYLAMVSGWSSTGIYQNIKSVKSEIFVQPWTPSFLPSGIMFYSTKSIYRNGTGMDQLFSSMFTPVSIKQTEIWSGTYNTNSQRGALFCNLDRSDAFVKDDILSEGTILYDCDPFNYLSGDVVDISKVVHASAAIPFVTEGVYIDGKRYIDGGVAYSSPLIPISEHLKVNLEKHFESTSPDTKLVQMFYFCSYDMDQRFNDSMYDASIGLLVHSSGLQDRAFALNFIRQFADVGIEPAKYEDLTSKKLREILRSIQHKSYIIFLFPRNALAVDVANFTTKQLLQYMNWTIKNYSAIVWSSK